MRHRLAVRIPLLAGLLAALLAPPAGRPLAAAEDTNKAEIRPEIVVPLMRTPPTIDGSISEDEWRCAKITGLISQQRPNRIEFRGVEAWIGYDAAHIYLAMKSAVHPESGIITITRPAPGDADARFGHGDDTIELFFSPGLRSDGRSTVAGKVYQIIFNAAGAISDIAADAKKGTFETEWRAKMKTAHAVRDGYWYAETAIETASFDPAPLDDSWGIRICRNFKNPWDQSRLGINVIAFASPETMPLFRFSAAGPIVKHLSTTDAARTAVDIALSLSNPTDRPLSLKATLGNNAINQPRQYRVETVALLPGETKEVRYRAPVSDPESYPAAAVVKVASDDGKTVWYARDFLWDMRPRQAVWTPVPKADVRAVALDICHSPTLRKISLRGSFKDLKGREAVTAAAVEVRTKGAAKPIAARRISSFENFSFETVLDLPSGMRGDYDAVLRLSGDTSTPTQPVVVPFERGRFEWENNSIGITDEVIPPFTPLAVDRRARTVSCVLRTHTMAPTGLWEQVRAAGTDLLAGPVSLEMTSGGRTLAASPASLSFVSTAPNRVVAKSSFRIGELAVGNRVEFDYDGMMKSTLSLKQNGKTPIDRLSLVIPLKAGRARLMHPLGDGMRFNYGGAVPEGTGVIWESAKASRNAIIGTFLPYFWFGDEYRGLCWFAETDRGWILDDKRSALTLERTGSSVVLKVHFVNTPGVFERPIDIVFGLQASPAKPLPSDPPWQTTTFNGGGEGYPVQVMGSSFYWNGQMYANFPQNRDFTTIRKIAEAKKTGVSDKAYFDSLVKSWSEATHDLSFDYNKAHILNGGSAGKLKGVIPYTNLRGDLTWIPEWRTFQDEWSWGAYGKRTTDTGRKKGSTDFSIFTGRSRQDFLLYYYKKFFESGFDGIYWDNIYLQACFNPLMGPVYRRADGQIQPFIDIFRSRELLKRTMVLSRQMGRPNLSMVHMTNTNIVPVYSFAGSLLGWEWKYGLTDFQDRFSPDYIRAVNLPFNTGCVPVQLSGIVGQAPKEQLDWVARTRAGVTLVHELHVWGTDGPLAAVRSMLAGIGLGTPAAATHRYWDDDPVAAASADALKWIVYAAGGKRVAIVCDYGEGGRYTLRLGPAVRLPGRAAAVDWQTKEPVSFDGTTLAFTLGKHDYKVIVIE